MSLKIFSGRKGSSGFVIFPTHRNKIAGGNGNSFPKGGINLVEKYKIYKII
jgi:hypothetical protein